jgi:hydroxylamine reductase
VQSYGAAVIALELAKAFNTDVNGLPLSFAVSWFEQKAVAVLLTLLHLGVKNIRCVECVAPWVARTLGEELAV